MLRDDGSKAKVVEPTKPDNSSNAGANPGSDNAIKPDNGSAGSDVAKPGTGSADSGSADTMAGSNAGSAAAGPQVDTVIEIGGQDAKYIRLSGGRVIDCAMNEACSAGTGSFIEEQGRRFLGIRDVVELGEQALGATQGVSLGQHCSVFMAEIIDEAIAVFMKYSSCVK